MPSKAGLPDNSWGAVSPRDGDPPRATGTTRRGCATVAAPHRPPPVRGASGARQHRSLSRQPSCTPRSADGPDVGPSEREHQQHLRRPDADAARGRERAMATSSSVARERGAVRAAAPSSAALARSRTAAALARESPHARRPRPGSRERRLGRRAVRRRRRRARPWIVAAAFPRAAGRRRRGRAPGTSRRADNRVWADRPRRDDGGRRRGRPRRGRATPRGHVAAVAARSSRRCSSRLVGVERDAHAPLRVIVPRDMPPVLNGIAACPSGPSAITPPVPPASVSVARSRGARPRRTSRRGRHRASMSCATPSRMKYSPWPVADTAQARRAYVPAPMTGSRRCGPSACSSCRRSRCAAARVPAASSATAPTVPHAGVGMDVSVAPGLTLARLGRLQRPARAAR